MTESEGADANARYRAKHAHEIKAYKAEYRARNSDKLKAYAAEYRATHRDEIRISNRDRERARRAAEQAEVEKRAKNADKSRNYYNDNIDARRAYQRNYLADRRAADPEGFREEKKQRNKEWYDRHKEAQAAKRRDEYRDEPEKKRASARRYYEQHGDEVRAKRRDYYRKNREKQLASAAAWKRRESRRVAAGLPTKRLHRVASSERDANQGDADRFFARAVSSELRERLLDELRPPRGLLEAWRRDCYRARALDYERRHPEVRSDVVDRRTAEQVRMDAIARALNDRLRNYAALPARERVDWAAPETAHEGAGLPGLRR